MRRMHGAAKVEYIVILAGVAIAALSAATHFGWRLIQRYRLATAPLNARPAPDNPLDPIMPSGSTHPQQDEGPRRTPPANRADLTPDPDWLIGKDPDPPSRDTGGEAAHTSAPGPEERRRFREVRIGLFDGTEDERNRARRRREDAKDLREKSKVCGAMAADPATDPAAARVLREHSEGEVREAERLEREAAELEGAAEREESRKRIEEALSKDPDAAKKLREKSAASRKRAEDRRDSAERARQRATEQQKLAENPRANPDYVEARKKEAAKADQEAERADEDARQADSEAERIESEAAELDKRAPPLEAEKKERAARAELRAQSKPLRESETGLGMLPETAFNPGEHRRDADRSNHVAVAKYVLASADNPWVGVCAGSQDEFQQRIVLHELAHALKKSPDNVEKVKRFLRVRWEANAEQYRKFDAKVVRRLKDVQKQLADKETLADPEKERIRLLFADLEGAIGRLPDGEKRRRKQGQLARDRDIAAVRFAEGAVDELRKAVARDDAIADRKGARSPRLNPLPSRFPGDLHALENEEEYFAVAVELYFCDRERFDRSYTDEERAIIQGLFHQDGKDDLSRVK